ncbi:MAG: site-specific integrase, partial [Thermoleophilia bacterium]|nr:site-specific integrase [Thermoleophilia bacterium]
STAVDYANTLENHLIPFFGARRLAKITVQDILDYRAKKAEGTAPVRDQPPGRGGRIKRKLAPKTINNQITLLALILGHASADGLIGQNPASSREAKRPLKLQVPHRERDYLRPHEVPAYLDACSDFWRPRAMTLLLTGCRIGELIALRWDDVDWLSSAIIIARAYKPLEGEAGSTKGDETGRRVDIGPQLLDELANHRTRAEESSLGWDEDLIFPGPNGGHDDAQRLLRYEHRPALKRAGLRTSLVAHELRHTAAAIWLSLGYPMEYVRRQMGHRQISTTINSYGHLERTMIPDAAARAESAVLRPAGDTLR